MLDAEIALAADDEGDRARALAESVLASPGASAEIRCRALELLGRVRRAHDLDGARDAFEQALATADAAGLAVWRLRALHELGTIDMFDHAGTSRLSAGAAHRQRTGRGQHRRGHRPAAHRHGHVPLRARRGRTSRPVRAGREHPARPGHDQRHRARLPRRGVRAAPRSRRDGALHRAGPRGRTRRPGDRRQRAGRRPGDAGAARRRYGRRPGRLRPRHRRPRHRAPARPGALPWPVAAAARRARRPAGGGRDRSRPGHRPDRQPGQPGPARVRRGDPRRAGR